MKEGAPPSPGGARFLGFEPARLALVVALAAGAFFRIWGYGARASLWIDEARLALNIAGSSYGGLLRPLDYDQAAPLLFLWAEKLATQIGGVNELALRALPFAAGMVLPFLVLALGARLAGRPAGMVAAGLAAVAWPLVRYSFELKPYEVDALVCTGLLLLCLPRSGGPDKPAMGPAAAVGGALAVWASAPAVFVLAALGAWAGMAARRFPAVRREVLGTLVLWAASFAGAYALVYRPAATNSYLHEFWADYLVRVGDPGWPVRALRALRDFLAQAFGCDILELPATARGWFAVGGAAVVAGGTALGAHGLTRTRGRPAAWLAAGPIALAFLASAFGIYPFAIRLVLFAVPLLAVLAGAGITEALAGRRRARWALVSLLGAVMAVGVLRDLARASVPVGDEHLRPLLERLARAIRPGEPVYVIAGALPAWTFYTTDWARPDRVRLARMAKEASYGGRAFENAPPRGHPVNGEGADLVFPYARGVELLGVPSGVHWRSPGAGSRSQSATDAGWAESEASRIRAAAHPSAWVIIAHAFDQGDQLTQALEATGALLSAAFGDRGTRVLRYYWVESPDSIR